MTFPGGRAKFSTVWREERERKKKKKQREEEEREEKSLKFEKAAVASRRVAGGNYEDGTGRHGRRREDGS